MAIYDLLNDDQKKVFERAATTSTFAFEDPQPVRASRANVLVQRLGVGGVFRLVPSTVKSPRIAGHAAGPEAALAAASSAGAGGV